MKTLVFSDVHLKITPDAQKNLHDFTAFLQNVDPQRYNRIVILGDLFDFWFEYRHVIFSDYFEVLRALAQLRDAGIELHLVCGNHDFWAGRFLETHLSLVIHRGPYLCEGGGRRVLFVHGDGVNPRDYGYRIYKGIARSRLAVWLFGKLHPDRAMSIAQLISWGSRALFKVEDPSKGRQVVPVRNFARRTLENGEVDIVVCGHSHYPIVEEFQTAGGARHYINSGDWLNHRTYVDWDAHEFDVKVYDAEAWRLRNEGTLLHQVKNVTLPVVLPNNVPEHESGRAAE